MSLSFSKKENAILLEEMKKNPVLWEIEHAHFKNKNVRNDVWMKIASKVGKSVEKCKKRWRNIKDTYDRHESRRMAPDSSTKTPGTWALLEKLSFLKTTDEHHGSPTNLTLAAQEEVESPCQCFEEVIVSESSSTTLPTTPIPSLSKDKSSPQSPTSTLKRRRPSGKEEISIGLFKNEGKRNEPTKPSVTDEIEDDVDLFFRSLAKSVKKLTPPLQQRAKIETLITVGRLETEMWQFNKSTL